MLFKSILFVGLASIASAVPNNYHHDHLHWHARRQINSTAEYDYVVVGSGAGGGPLASRLAIAGYKVLIIEAGDDQGDAVEQMVPALQLQSTEYTPMKWDYFVQHYDDLSRQEKDSKMVYQEPNGEYYVGLSPPANAEPLGILYPRSGTLGGCTAHNAMVTIYPFESDWTYLQTLTGNDSWAPDHMRTYFEKLERCRYLPNSVVGHGFDGWLTTFLTPLTLVLEDLKVISLVLSAASAMGKGLLTSIITTVTGLGHILLLDLNNPSPGRDQDQNMWQVPIAVDPTDGSKRNGPRNFILDTANAKNADGSRMYHLDVQLQTLATKIRFQNNGSTPRAVGVEYLQGQSLYAADPRYSGSQGIPGYVAAKKEVIISAGAFNTPQLLKLSGIGPRAELNSFGIDLISDLAGVGTNLQDRYETGLVSTVPTDFTLTRDCTFGYQQPDPCLQQWQNGLTPIDKGTYVTNGIAIGITKKSTVAARSDDPDILVTGVPATFKGYFPRYSEALKEKNHWTWITLKAHSHNNGGEVRLRSTDPRERPQISFNYFDTGNTDGGGDLDDLQAVYDGMMLGREMYQKLIPLDGRFKETWPGPNVKGEALKEFIKNEAWGHHASCTAPIGADDDPMAVLDSDFRVRGVDSLRVVDASVFPKIPGTYIALPIFMISEKAADVIINA